MFDPREDASFMAIQVPVVTGAVNKVQQATQTSGSIFVDYQQPSTSGTTSRNISAEGLQNHCCKSSKYFLNKSSGKFLLVGYDLVNNQVEPVVKLSSSKESGQKFAVATWRRFCECFNVIGEYLRGSQQKFATIALNQQQIVLFKICYGKRTVLIDNVCSRGTNTVGQLSSESAIGLQLPSFEGLVSVRDRVNINLEQLIKNASKQTTVSTR